MKYYAFIINSLGEYALFAQAESRPEIEAELRPLLAAGFPEEKTKIVRAGGTKIELVHCHLVFIFNDGEVMEYAIHTNDPHREFLIASEMVTRKQFEKIIAVRLCDIKGQVICSTELGNIYVPGKSTKKELQGNTLERYADRVHFRT